jgi:hypothetical protein
VNSRNDEVIFPEERSMIANETQETPGRDPPFVIDVFGEVAANGKAIGLRIQRSQQGPVDLCVRIQDVHHMVSIMLALSCEAKRLYAPPEVDTPPSAAVPLPLSAINVGLDEQNQTFLMLEVGTAALMFALPTDALEDVGRTLLALSARATGKPC